MCPLGVAVLLIQPFGCLELKTATWHEEAPVDDKTVGGFSGNKIWWFFLVCPTRTGRGGLPEFLGAWVSNRPPSSPCRVGHCGGLWVSTEGAGQGILPVVVGWITCGGWVGGHPIAPPPPPPWGWDICGSGGLPTIWVKSPPPPPPPMVKKNPDSGKWNYVTFLLSRVYFVQPINFSE